MTSKIKIRRFLSPEQELKERKERERRQRNEARYNQFLAENRNNDEENPVLKPTSQEGSRKTEEQDQSNESSTSPESVENTEAQLKEKESEDELVGVKEGQAKQGEVAPQDTNKEQQLFPEEEEYQPLVAKRLKGTPEVAANKENLSLEPKKESGKESAQTTEEAKVANTTPTDRASGPAVSEGTREINIGSPGTGAKGGTAVPQQAAPINAEDPGQIIEQLKNTPPTQIAATYAQAGSASAQALEKQRQQVQENIPEIPAPTGLPSQLGRGHVGSKKAIEKATRSKREPKVEVKSKGSGQGPAKYDPEVPEAPPALTPAPTQLAGGNAEKEGNDEALSKSAQRALSKVSIDTNKISTSAGERPNVDLTGEADPNQMEAVSAQSGQEVQAAKAKAAKDINQDFGENSIPHSALHHEVSSNTQKNKRKIALKVVKKRRKGVSNLDSMGVGGFTPFRSSTK